MRKRLLLIALVIMLSTGTVVQSEMRAEAAGTVTAVGVVKGVLVLLAIAGVGITLGSIFDQGDIEESAVVKFTTWLNNHDPEFYTEFMLAATAITSGRVINTMSPLFYFKLKQNATEYFGTSTAVETSAGTVKMDIQTLAFIPNGTQYLTEANGVGSMRLIFHRADALLLAMNTWWAMIFTMCLYLQTKRQHIWAWLLMGERQRASYY